MNQSDEILIQTLKGLHRYIFVLNVVDAEANIGCTNDYQNKPLMYVYHVAAAILL
jgi:hypothetical protein